MLRSHVLFFSTLILFTQSAFSYEYKQGNIWYFGNHAGLDFNSGSPLALTNGSIDTWDCSAAIADRFGSLLFYSDGETIWTYNHSVMFNGSGLAGSTTGGQCAMIIPKPESLKEFYVFTTSEFASGAGFCYSTVDMSRQGGLGEVMLKNIPLITPASEKMCCIYNFHLDFWWVIAHEWNSNQFRAYKLDSYGLDTVPVISAVGSVHTGGSYGYAHNAMGQMNFSPDGSKLGLALYLSGVYELFDFDIDAGVVSNPITVPDQNGSFGLEFSPDGRKVYTTRLYDTHIYQYSIGVFTQAAIVASKTLIGTIPFSGSYNEGYLQLAPDGKIYLAYENATSLSEIDDPNATGASCLFQAYGVSLGGSFSRVGLCNFIFRQQLLVNSVAQDRQQEQVAVYPNPVQDILNIRTTNSRKSKMKVQVLDQRGVLVFQDQYNCDEEIKIDMRSDTIGKYCILIEDGRKRYSTTFIKD